MVDARRSVPRTDAVLADARVQSASTRLGRARVKAGVSVALEHCRNGRIEAAEVVDSVLDTLPESATSLRRVVNATGVLVHTNLGRAPLSAAAVEAMGVAAGATDVELDLQTGRRGSRGRGALDALAAAVPQAQAVHVVNNGAAALLLVAAGLAAGRTIVIARGELVEIGDGFRIPDLLESAGATLREVGTTNRAHLDDYERAIDDDTALVLKVHPSNFMVCGFTSSVPVRALSTLPVPVVADIGSGLLRPHRRLPEEPSADHALRDGAALVTASGDKLLGGPQAGLLLGRADLVQMLRRHPIARALRISKVTLSALEATLTGPIPPVPAALAASVDDLRVRAERIRADLEEVVDARVVDSIAAVGGGGAPGVTLPSVAVALPHDWAAALRAGPTPVLGHVEHGDLLLDLIAVDPAEDSTIVQAVRAIATGHGVR
ncbi:MAG: L-seryl-tRNA(Sec) selenium transferase [Ornithinimicrobium sp.]|uniref:L-seryl-tRNA(Sec) selenium transferase n=1 Tax=Ornithinimicrobium sp. TaxID=1977084 RepID=UPI003D9B458A